MRRSLLIGIVLMCLGRAGLAQELLLGGVPIPLGAPEGPVLTHLREQFQVRGVDGGWEVRSRDAADLRTPLVGVGTQNGRIQGVSYVWGPGFTPTLEYMSEQLAHALPAHASCEVENVVHPSEGGTVRTLTFRCARVMVRCQTGIWAGGNTAALSIRLE